MSKFSAVAAAAGLAAMSLVSADMALAACTRLAFSVNDYGKIGPTNDAKNMLDKYIAKWAAERKITGYNTGPKEVTCELFIDVIVFDEYTCKAAATVCWNGPLPAGHQTEAGVAPPVQNKASGGAVRAKAAKQDDAAIATGSVKAAPAAAGAPAAPKAPAAAKAADPARATPAAAPAKVLPPAPPAAPAAN